MTTQHKILLVLLIFLVNTLIAVGYFVIGFIRTRRNKEKKENTKNTKNTENTEKNETDENKKENKKKLTKYVILSIFMFLCPVAGPIFLGLGTVLYKIFFDSSIDLAAITFSKERVDVLEHPDMETEINLVPMEEAIIIDDKENLRQLLLTVLRGDISKSINTVTKALNSSDSEASHYAASAIMDVMNEFQTTLQKFHAQLETDPNDKEVNQLFIEYLIKMLNTNFLSDMELKTYVYSLAQTCQNVYDYDKSNLKTIYYSGVVNLLVKIEDIQTAKLWVSRLQEEYPDEIETYRCILRFYYLTQDKEQFFYYMDRLKKSNIPIDKDLLELIRIYA